jgi:hypothetical protein
MVLRLLSLGLDYEHAFKDAKATTQRLCRVEELSVCMLTAAETGVEAKVPEEMRSHGVCFVPRRRPHVVQVPPPSPPHH